MRSQSIDAIRGIAVVLMLFDHALDVAGSPLALRLGPTRLALPLFMVLSGWLLVGKPGPSRRRSVQLGLAAAASAGGSYLAGLDAPDILTVYVAALVVRRVIRRTIALDALPVCALCLTVAQFAPPLWAGYSPWIVLGLISLGEVCRQGGFPIPAIRPCRPFEYIGRHALPVFVVQAWVFAALKVGVMS